MRIYLDVSCLNRPFDDQGQARIRFESEAVTMIFDEIDDSHWVHMSSEMVDIVVDIEVHATQNEERRRRVVALLPDRRHRIPLTREVYRRAETLESLGFKAADATHVAAAESGGVDVLLTCDDRMLHRARRLGQEVGVRVENPVDWLREQIDASNS